LGKTRRPQTGNGRIRRPQVRGARKDWGGSKKNRPLKPNTTRPHHEGMKKIKGRTKKARVLVQKRPGNKYCCCGTKGARHRRKVDYRQKRN